jgi:hypothetical protein
VLLPSREQLLLRCAPTKVRAHVADVVDDAAAGAEAEALGHRGVVGAELAAERLVRGGVLRFEVDDGLVKIEHRGGEASRAKFHAWSRSFSGH